MAAFTARTQGYAISVSKFHTNYVRLGTKSVIPLSAFEFPRYCYDLNMKEYRFVYGAHLGHDKEAKQGVSVLASRIYSLD